jgi:hypothetical protein
MLKNSSIFLVSYCSWWGSMRRLRRNHQKQPTIDRLGAVLGLPCGPAAPTHASRLRAALGTPRIQARLPARGSSRAGSTICLPTQGSSRAAACPRGSGSHLPTQDSSGAAICPLGFSTRLSMQGSSGGATCPHGSGLDENRRAEQLRKQSS